MQYISPIPIEHTFTLTSDIFLKQLSYNINDFINSNCYFKNVIIAKDYRNNFYTDVDVHLSQKFSNNKTTFKEDIFICNVIFNIDDYHDNLPDYNHDYPTCIELEDIVIDSFTKRWFEVESVILNKTNPNDNYIITYHLKSSDEKEIYLSEEKLSFYINNNIFHHVPFRKPDNTIVDILNKTIKQHTKEATNT